MIVKSPGNGSYSFGWRVVGNYRDFQDSDGMVEFRLDLNSTSSFVDSLALGPDRQRCDVDPTANPVGSQSRSPTATSSEIPTPTDSPIASRSCSLTDTSSETPIVTRSSSSTETFGYTLGPIPSRTTYGLGVATDLGVGDLGLSVV
jgi:hypothetical protein